MFPGVSLDTNVVAYAEGIDGSPRQVQALDLLSRLPRNTLNISIQVIGELYNVLTKRGVSREHARERSLYWKQFLTVLETSGELMETAVDLATDHRMRVWDALILAAAAEARCDLLLSEDFQDGFAWRGVTVVNPFAGKPHKMLAKLLRG
ncbi:MAG: PIN domain-containing protein [Proteobacteria bacterium]|nr:PIN domain-containing protein [Pseudomonadota bacterium]